MKRIALAIGAGIVATGAVVASAASLGTLNVRTLGTRSEAVAPCDENNVVVKWSGTAIAYSGAALPADSTYKTDKVVVNVPANCAGADMKIAVSDNAGGAALATSSATNVAAGDLTMTLTALVDTKDVLQTTVTMYNDTP